VQSLEILGCRLDVLDADQATETIIGFAKQHAGAQVVTLGTEMVVYAQSDRRFRDVVNASALSLCDTAGLLAVARRRGARLRERVSGVELIERICARAVKEGLSVYLMGGSPGVAEEAANALRMHHPGLHVVGTLNGYFLPDESRPIAEAIRDSGADILFAGLGSPRQEFWLAENLPLTSVGVAVGVGGSFDVLSGNVRRAPAMMRRLNAEWLYRLVTEPRRWRRQLALPRFVWLVAKDSLRRAPRGSNS
jgi:N-acetylglucosaminyldiphosphoundecaprenol N-acetyl-beta-D-mannosaminyltransferase